MSDERSRPCPRASEWAPHDQYRDENGSWYCPIERSAEIAEEQQREREANANRTSRVDVSNDDDLWQATAYGLDGQALATGEGAHAAEALANLAAELIA